MMAVDSLSSALHSLADPSSTDHKNVSAVLAVLRDIYDQIHA
jgi:hypothetical protein